MIHVPDTPVLFPGRPDLRSEVSSEGFKLILGSFCKFLEGFLYYTFVMQKEYLSEMKIIINNDKTIFVTTNANVSHRSKEIHVEKLKWLDGGDDAL